MRVRGRSRSPDIRDDHRLSTNSRGEMRSCDGGHPEFERSRYRGNDSRASIGSSAAREVNDHQVRAPPNVICYLCGRDGHKAYR